MMRGRRRGEQVERRRAEVAADRDRQTRRLHHLADQGRDGALAVGAGDGGDRRPRLAREQLDVAHHLDAARRGLAQQRLGERHAGRGDHHRRGAEQREVEAAVAAGGARRDALELRAARRIGAAVGHREPPAARGEMPRHRHAGAAEPHDERGAGRRGGADGVGHRSLSVARPASTRKKVMIQKRTMIFGSAQPFFSKWWWMGAMRKMRLPVSL